MTPETIIRCTRAYGSTNQLAVALGELQQSLRHWMAGRRPPPEDLQPRIVAALTARARERRLQGDECARLAQELGRAEPAPEEPRPLSWGGEAAQ